MASDQSHIVCACLAQRYLNGPVLFFFVVSGAMSPKSNSWDFLGYLIVILDFFICGLKEESKTDEQNLNTEFINTTFYFCRKNRRVSYCLH